MFIEAIVIGLIIGFIKGGRLNSISSIYFRGTIFLIVGLLLQLVPILLGYFKLFKGSYGIISFMGLILLLVFLARNLDKKGIWIILIGGSLNVLAMIFSGFAMPIDFKALEYSGLSSMVETIKDGSIVNMVNVDHAPGIIKVLSKFIALPSFYPLTKVISVGDIIMSIGMIWFTAQELGTKRHLRNMGRSRRVSYL